MEATLTINPDGTLVIAVANQEGLDFETAKAKVAAYQLELQESLGLADLPRVEWGTEIERHLHNPDGSHVNAWEHQ